MAGIRKVNRALHLQNLLHEIKSTENAPEFLQVSNSGSRAESSPTLLYKSRNDTLNDVVSFHWGVQLSLKKPGVGMSNTGEQCVKPFMGTMKLRSLEVGKINSGKAHLLVL